MRSPSRQFRRAGARSRLLALVGSVLLLAGLAPVAAVVPVLASHTAAPTSVTVAGSFQEELGCPGDWQPECSTTNLTATHGAWRGQFSVPAGDHLYKAALNGGWAESYGTNGNDRPLNLAATTNVRFYYSHATHWVADSENDVIAVAPGDFQDELGCPGEWDPACLRSWLQDPDGDGTFTFTTTAIPPGSYLGKVAHDESWTENYGAGGAPDGPNIGFGVANAGDLVTFSYVASTHVLTITSSDPSANNIEWDGVRHDSRDLLYRTPGGAVPAGTPVTLRLRTFAGDVTAVQARLFSVDQNGQQLLPMERVAHGVDCYQASLDDRECDFWAVTIPADWGADNLWYRFVVSDGTDTDFYADNTAALDGGLGATTDDAVDQSYALMLHEPGFEAPDWAKDAVIYQIFPDRFRNGRKDNDPKTGDVRYDDPVVKLGWGVLPEGYCRNYAGATATTCPARFGGTGVEQPRGRDYMGGDLRGVDQKLDYLAALGVTTVYFNPIFDAGSNHSYDTQDFTTVDPYFGSQKDWENLVKHADERGIRLVLDGVFNHLSSDSPFFDRYHHFATAGACESTSSPYRSWFYFTDVAAGLGTCVGSDGTPNGARYEGWFGFDSIPVIRKDNSAVQEYFLTGSSAIAKRWLAAGAAGWRMDVSGDPSFPAGYWETFKEVVEATDPEALTISETWQKDSTLLRMIRGDRLDTTMNYRLRDAVIGFLAPGGFDSKGFADSGRVISPSEFLNRLASIREDYPDAAYYSLMNLLDSHDTERLLWTLTPGPETRAGRELDAANLAAGKRRVQIASLIQFTVPGAPTVYYGDEVGVTGDDDPDDRRTYPWADLGGAPDTALHGHYTTLAQIRRDLDVLTDGDFRALLADDASSIAAYGRKTGSQAAIVVVNRGSSAAAVSVPVGGYLPDGVALTKRYEVGAGGSAAATTASGSLAVTVPANGAIVLASATVDLTAPAPPTLALDGEGDGTLDVSWSPVPGAASYDVWVSPVTGGGYVLANDAPVSGTSFTVSGLTNAVPAFVVVTASDAAGNRSAFSNEVEGLPHLEIGWERLQWPPSITHTISATTRTENVYGQVWVGGGTDAPGPMVGLLAQLGMGPDGSDPTGNDAWTWVDAEFNVQVGNNDEFRATLLPEQVGTFDYAYRFSTTDGRDWRYADFDDEGGEYSVDDAGSLSVVSSGDVTPPAPPTDLTVTSASPAGIELTWGDVSDVVLYEVRRAGETGPFTRLARTGDATYADTTVVEGATYRYVVVAIDESFNRSGDSDTVEATAARRTVTVRWVVTVPETTDAARGDRPVSMAGTLSRLDGGHPDWTPGAVDLTRTNATTWTIDLTGLESTQIAYKFVLESEAGADLWKYVEKAASECAEISDRQLTLTYGSDGVQVVPITVENWRNVAPCGN